MREFIICAETANGQEWYLQVYNGKKSIFTQDETVALHIQEDEVAAEILADDVCSDDCKIDGMDIDRVWYETIEY